MRNITRIVIHHSASSRTGTTLALIDAWHRNQGYDGIGYHRVIEGNGAVRQGRADSRIGAHAYGHNHDSIGICVTGNFETETPTTAQIDALVQTCAVLCKRHGIPAAAIVAHRDLMATACPGKNLYSQLPAIRSRVAGYLK